MKGIAVLVLIAVVILLVAGGYFLGKIWIVPEDNNNGVIGGETDTRGCLTAAGYSWNEEIGACVREWEFSDASLKEIAKVAVSEIVPEAGLTVVDIEKSSDLKNDVYYVHIKYGDEREEIITVGGGKALGRDPSLVTVSGQVLLGPQCPVAKADEPCPDKPYQTIVDISLVHSTTSSFFISPVTDENGFFAVKLPAGEYSFRPRGGKPLPTCKEVLLALEAEKDNNISLSCDTGIR